MTRDRGVGERGAYVFRRYSERFPALFAYEKKRLRKILPSALIEHIGSSAVPGLGGKGIIDVLVAVPKDAVADGLKKLIARGYTYTGRGGCEERAFLMRMVRYAGRERQVHVHLVQIGSGVWQRDLAVRDYLRHDKVAAKEYAKVKRMAVREAKGEGEKYRQLKRSFLNQLEKKAMMRA
jgi:GrpB-like predicted nucleotidyltransferase (UPF0157 family)